MPTAVVKFKTGEEVRFFVPEGFSESQAASMAPQMYQLQQEGVDITKEPEWDQSIFGHVGEAVKGVPRGAIRGAELAATGLAQLLPEGAEVPVRDFIARASEAAQGPFQPGMRYEDALSGKFGEALGTTVPLVAAGTIGGPVTAGALTTGLGGAMGAGEAIRRAEGAGATEEQISAAGRLGVIPGLGEMLVPFAIGRGIKQVQTLRKLQEAAGEETAYTMLDRIRRAGMAAGGEGAQEAAAEVAQNLIAQDIYDPDTDVYGGLGEAAGLGAGVGGFIQALVDLALPRGRAAPGAPGPVDDTPTEETTPPPATPPPPTVDPEQARMESLINQFGQRPAGALVPVEQTGQGIERVMPPQYRPRQEVTNLTPEQANISRRVLDEIAGPAPIEGEVVPEEVARGDVEQGEMFNFRGGVNPRERQFKRPPVMETPGRTQRGTVAEEVARLTREAEQEAVVRAPKQQEPTFDETVGANEQVAEVNRGQSEAVVRTPKQQKPTFDETVGANEQVAEVNRGQSEAVVRTPKQQKPTFDETIGANEQVAEVNRGQSEAVVRTPKQQKPTFDETVGANEQVAEVNRGQSEAVVSEAAPEPAPVAQEETVQEDTAAPVVDEVAETPPIDDETRQRMNRSVQERARLEGRAASQPEDYDVVGDLLENRPRNPVTNPNPEGSAAFYFDTYGLDGGLSAMAAEAQAVDIAETEADNRELKRPTAIVGEGDVVSPRKEKVREGQRRFVGKAGRQKRRGEAAVQWVRDNPDISPEMKRTLEREMARQERMVKSSVEATRRTAVKKRLTTQGQQNRNLDRALDDAEQQVDNREAAEAELTPEETPTKETDFGLNIAPSSAELRDIETEEADIMEGFDREVSSYDLNSAQRDLLDNKFADQLFEAKAEAAEAYLKFISKNPDKAREAISAYKDLYGEVLELKSSAVASTTLPLSDNAYNALQDGDLRGALEAVALGVNNKWTARVAEILAANVGDTKVKLDSSIDSAGQFDPNTNTITINPAEGGNVHTLLHEMTHAVVSHTIANPNHPVTQQLRKIYEQVKKESPTYYGTESLQEFVAEAWSNPNFQHMLENMGYMGRRETLLGRIRDAVVKLYRSLRYFNAPGITGNIDELIASIVDTAPRHRMAPVLNAITADNFGNTGFGMGNKMRNAFNPKYNLNRAIKEGTRLVKYGSLDKIKSLASWALAAPQFSDLWSPIIGKPIASKLNDLIQKHSGEEFKRTEAANALVQRIEKWAKENGTDKKNIMNELMSLSTRGEVNWTLPENTYGGQKKELHKKLNRMAQSLGPTGKRLYEDMLAANEALYNDIRKALESYVSKALPPEAAAKLNNKLAKKLLDRRKIDPFFTLGRPYGSKAWVSFQTYVEDPFGDITQEMARITFPSKADADNFIEDVRRDPQAYSAMDFSESSDARDLILNSIERVDRYDLDAFKRKAPQTGFLNSLFEILEGTDPDIQSQVMETVLEYTSEQSVLKAFHKRKNVPGYGDMLSAFARNVQRTSRNIANLQYGREFYQYRQELETWRKSGEGSLDQIKLRLMETNPITDPQGFSGNENLKDFERATLLDLVDELRKQGLTGAELQDAYRNGLVDYANDLSSKSNWVASEFAKRASYAAAPKSATWATGLKAMGFGWTLGFNVSSVVVNAVQVPAVTFPILGGEYGFKESGKQIKNAYKTYTSLLGMTRVQTDLSGTEVTMDGKHAPSLLNIIGDKALLGDLRKNAEKHGIKDIDAEIAMLTALGERLRMHGMLGHSIIEETQELQEADPGLLTKVNNWMGKMFHTGERMNREVSMIAAFKLEMDRLSTDNTLTEAQKFDKAVEKAMYISDFTHGSAHMRARAPLAQSNLGNVLFMYKSYGAAMYYVLYKTARNMLAGESPEVRKIAMKQMAGMFGMVGMLSGAAGLPMMGVIGAIHDFFKEDDEEDFKTLMRYHLSDLGTEGLLNTLTNLGFSERTSMSSLLYRASPVPNQDNKLYAFAEPLLGPVFGMLTRADRVTDLLAEENYQRAWEAALPAFAASPFRATRLAMEGAQTMRGDPIDQDINAWNIAGQFFGLAPADYLRKMEQNAAIKGIEVAVNRERSNLLNKYFTAHRFNDYEKMAEIQEDMDKFSQRNPDFDISPRDIRNSMRQRDENSEMAGTMNGIIVNKNFLRRAKEMRENFGIEDPW